MMGHCFCPIFPGASVSMCYFCTPRFGAFTKGTTMYRNKINRKRVRLPHQPVEDGLVDHGGREGERGRSQELRGAVHGGPVCPVEHLLEGLPAVSSEGRYGSHHREKCAPVYVHECMQTCLRRRGRCGVGWSLMGATGLFCEARHETWASEWTGRGEGGEGGGEAASQRH